MTKYSVNVELDNETLDALKNGFEMQVFKGVKAHSYARANGHCPRGIDHRGDWFLQQRGNFE